MKAHVMKHQEPLEKHFDLSADQALEKSNPLATVWLFVLGILLVGTLLCTAVLVAWPILAHLFAG